MLYKQILLKLSSRDHLKSIYQLQKHMKFKTN